MSSDSKTFYFKLNPNIYFSNGTALTTKHIQDIFNEAIQSRMFSPLERILGAQDYQQKKAKIILGFKIINNQEFIIKSTLPFPNLILQLASSDISIFLHKDKSDILIGTGPYMVSNFDMQNQTLVLQKNPFYKRKVFYYDQVVFNHKESINTEISESLPEKSNLSQFDLKEYLISQLYFFGFNGNNKKLANLKTRKYLACLLPDQNLNYAHDSFIPMGIFGYNSSIHFNCDNTNIPPIDLSKSFTVTYYLDSLAEIAKNYCNILESKSIHCDIQKINTGEKLINLKRNGSLEIFMARFKPIVPLPDALFSSLRTGHPANLFDTSRTTAFSLSFDENFDKLYNIPPGFKNELMNVYTKLNELIINNYVGRPISYGTAEKLWVKKSILVPDIDINGLTGLDLTEVKPL